MFDCYVLSNGEVKNTVENGEGEDFFTLDEIETVADYKWEYGTEATVKVVEPGGLSKGSHEVTLSTVIRNEYVPVPFSGSRTVTVEIV